MDQRVIPYEIGHMRLIRTYEADEDSVSCNCIVLGLLASHNFATLTSIEMLKVLKAIEPQEFNHDIQCECYS